MSVIAHWLAYPAGGMWCSGPHVCRDEHGRDVMAKAGWRIEGPFVSHNSLQGAVEALREFQDELTKALNAHGVPAMPSWQDAIDYLATHGGGSR
jgi:hypothetical protein